ncbi:unnamed protein product [Trichobilharzia regenti]|nr:unnamed protein product [Trichobilharzia regenti]
MSNPSEETNITKRSRLFKGKVVQHRNNLKKRSRHSHNPNHRHQSTGDITQSCIQMDQNGSTMCNNSTKDDTGNTGRKMPRWLRLLKLTSISATTNITLDGLNKTDNTTGHHQYHHRQGNLNSQHHHHQQQQPQEEIHSFLGNLGIGAYVGEEENAFVNSDTSEDIQLTNKSSSKPISKSMINLSSISLWQPKRRTSDQTNDTEALTKEIVDQYSCSSRSSRVSCASQTSSSSPQPQPPAPQLHPQSTSPFSSYLKQNDSPADKMSTSKGTTTRTPTTAAAISQNLDQFRQSEFYESMPLILKTVIYQTSVLNINTNMKQNYFKGFMSNNLTPKPSTNTITRTNSNNNNNNDSDDEND